MKSVVLYLHMHQPLRIKQYSIFSVGHDHDYWTEKDWYAGPNNERIFKKVNVLFDCTLADFLIGIGNQFLITSFCQVMYIIVMMTV